MQIYLNLSQTPGMDSPHSHDPFQLYVSVAFANGFFFCSRGEQKLEWWLLSAGFVLFVHILFNHWIY